MIAHIHSALIAAAKHIIEKGTDQGGLGDIPVKWPSIDITPPNDSPWLKVDIIPADTVVSSLGVGGLDTHTGVLQITLKWPINKGNGGILDACSRLNNFFHAGARLSHESVSVLVLMSSYTQPLKDNSCLQSHFSVSYQCKLQRPTTLTNL